MLLQREQVALPGPTAEVSGVQEQHGRTTKMRVLEYQRDIILVDM
jgi:hypothetical protein